MWSSQEALETQMSSRDQHLPARGVMDQMSNIHQISSKGQPHLILTTGTSSLELCTNLAMGVHHWLSLPILCHTILGDGRLAAATTTLTPAPNLAPVWEKEKNWTQPPPGPLQRQKINTMNGQLQRQWISIVDKSFVCLHVNKSFVFH